MRSYDSSARPLLFFGFAIIGETTMGWVDVAIPGLVGLLLAFTPRWSFKPGRDGTRDVDHARRFRGIGFPLLGVAALYSLVKIGMLRTR
jgi:hypothetical protein